MEYWGRPLVAGRSLVWSGSGGRSGRRARCEFPRRRRPRRTQTGTEEDIGTPARACGMRIDLEDTSTFKICPADGCAEAASRAGTGAASKVEAAPEAGRASSGQPFRAAAPLNSREEARG